MRRTTARRWQVSSPGSRRRVEIKRNMEQGADEVRIMTVHGAKGLEAPIVILPDTRIDPRCPQRGLRS